MATILENVYTLSTHLEDAYTALENKGATIPQQKNATNLSATIDSVPAGGGFTIDDLLAGTEPKDLVINVAAIGNSTQTTGGGSNLFYGRPDVVKTVTFSDLSSVGSYGCYSMFKGQKNLTDVECHQIKSLGSYAFGSMFEGCTSLSSVNIDINQGFYYESSYNRMFAGCTALTVAPDLQTELLSSSTTRNVYYQTFQGCTSLSSVGSFFDYPVSLAAQQPLYQTFNGCTSLTGTIIIRIQRGTTIGTNAANGCFSGGTNLEKGVLDFSSFTSVPSLGSVGMISLFGNTSDTRLEIRVPAALEATWKTATNWATYADRIVGV